MNIVYLLAGKRLSRARLTPHDAAPPMTPPAIVFPTKAAPATTIGATFASGVDVNNRAGGFDDEAKSMVFKMI